MSLFELLFGKCVVSTQHKNAAKLLNICMKLETAYTNPKFSDGTFSIECGKSAFDRIAKACENRGVVIERSYYGGLPMLAAKYKNRLGLLVGAVLAAAMVLLSLNVVWRVDVSGNESVSCTEVETLLAENGFGVGSFISSADLTLIENRIMKSDPRIAWISVNMNGTVANVEIRESRKGESRPKNAADLIAVRDGKIERIESFDGKCVVKVGDVVRAGDLLVSGIYSNENGDYRTTRAEGEIFARVLREFSIEVPFEITEKVYTGRKYSEIYINFFKKYIKVFANTGKMPPTCDIIYKNGELGLPSFADIPVGYLKTEYLEYVERAVTLSEEEAMERAFALLDGELGAFSEKAELLTKNIEFEISESAYILRCSVVCIENIAMTREIDAKTP